MRAGATFPVFGAGAAYPVQVGDQQSYTHTLHEYKFYKDSTFIRGLPFLLIAGPLLYSFGVESGWTPIGDKSEGVFDTLDYLASNWFLPVGGFYEDARGGY